MKKRSTSFFQASGFESCQTCRPSASETPKPARRRGRTAAKSEASRTDAGEASPEPGAEAAKPARRTRTRKAATPDPGTAEAGEPAEESAPKAAGGRSTRGRRTKAADAGAEAAGPAPDTAGAEGDEAISGRLLHTSGTPVAAADVVYGDASALQPNYTVFGTVDAASLAVIDKVARAGVTSEQPGSGDGKPVMQVTIKTATVS